ncbi:MAG: hypothetical protein E6I08_14105 [Chloroflexi bacterium]|nr:MAG: hypothetical protein E6I08_14105 [Chloroflexota bacterium]
MGETGRASTEPRDMRDLRNGLEDLARSLHASYLDRWGRHDPAGLERQAVERSDRERTGRRITAA